jgi:predicted RNase H-like nuclease (RuvC/YqgF family)
LEKQEKYVNNLKNKIIKYEKELDKKNEEIVSKDKYIKQLTQTIEELNNKIKSMKDNYKKEKKKEIIKLNDQISTLKNELEIKDQKEEMNNVKYNNLQLKYLKMFHNKKKLEQDNLLIASMKTINQKNKENTPNKLNSINNNLNCDTSIILPELKEKAISRSIKKINFNLYKKIIQENKTEIFNDKKEKK